MRNSPLSTPLVAALDYLNQVVEHLRGLIQSTRHNPCQLPLLCRSLFHLQDPMPFAGQRVDRVLQS